MKRLRMIILVLITVFSLASNVAILTSTSFFTLAANLFTLVTNIPNVASRIHPKSSKVMFKGKNTTVANAVGATTSSIKHRAIRTSTRSISSMAVEAIPYVDIAAIIGVTAWEIKDLCATVKDMEELNQALNPDDTPLDDDSSVCSVKVPAKEELMSDIEKVSADITNTVESFLYKLEEEQ